MKLCDVKECNVCGSKFYASKNCSCPMAKCNGVMHTVITPVSGKRLYGTLYRSGLPNINGAAEVRFIPRTNTIRGLRFWTADQWQEEYGKLPETGSATPVILELANVR